MARFPFGIPNSWFHVCYSDELAAGEVKTVHFLSRDIVLFRGMDGNVGALEPFCPHIGAHFGHGGKVEGNNIACPFHSWQFDTGGTCRHIPYTDKIPAKARAGAYPVLERNGLVFIWHNDQGLPPDFEIPVIPYFGAEGWTSSYDKYTWDVRTHPQDIMENAIDWPHFSFVHLMDPPKNRSHEFHQHMFKWAIWTRKDVQTMGVSDDFNIQAENWGLGFDWLIYSGMFTTVIVAGLTPIDEETTRIHFGVLGRLDGRTEEETRALLKLYMDDQSLAIQQDFGIWEHKGFQVRPALCESDGPIGEFRKWTKQFYSKDWAAAAA